MLTSLVVNITMNVWEILVVLRERNVSLPLNTRAVKLVCPVYLTFTPVSVERPI